MSPLGGRIHGWAESESPGKKWSRLKACEEALMVHSQDHDIRVPLKPAGVPPEPVPLGNDLLRVSQSAVDPPALQGAMWGTAGVALVTRWTSEGPAGPDLTQRQLQDHLCVCLFVCWSVGL